MKSSICWFYLLQKLLIYILWANFSQTRRSDHTDSVVSMLTVIKVRNHRY